MKTLIIFLAETRFSDLTYNNFVENVLKPDDDVCVCIAVDDNYDDKYYKMAKYKFIISIFTYDYEKIKKNFEVLGEEIIAKALHPKRIFRLIEEYGEDEVYNNYFE